MQLGQRTKGTREQISDRSEPSVHWPTSLSHTRHVCQFCEGEGRSVECPGRRAKRRSLSLYFQRAPHPCFTSAGHPSQASFPCPLAPWRLLLPTATSPLFKCPTPDTFPDPFPADPVPWVPPHPIDCLRKPITLCKMGNSLRSAETESIQLPREGRRGGGMLVDAHRVAGQGLTSCITTLSRYRQATESHCLQAVHTDSKQTVGCYIEDSDRTHSLVLQYQVSHKLWVHQGISASHPHAILLEPLR